MEEELKKIYQDLKMVSYPSQTPEQEKLMRRAEDSIEELCDSYDIDPSA